MPVSRNISRGEYGVKWSVENTPSKRVLRRGQHAENMSINSYFEVTPLNVDLWSCSSFWGHRDASPAMPWNAVSFELWSTRLMPIFEKYVNINDKCHRHIIHISRRLFPKSERNRWRVMPWLMTALKVICGLFLIISRAESRWRHFCYDCLTEFRNIRMPGMSVKWRTGTAID